jgi:sensor histidine kinase YesM
MKSKLDQSGCSPSTKPGFWIGSVKDIWFIPAVAVVIAVLLLIIQHAGLSEAGGKFLGSLIYSCVIGFPCVVILNWIGLRYTNRYPRLVILIHIGALLGIGIFGAFVGAVILQFVGIVPPGHYWHEIRTSFPLCIVITLVVGLSITSFETLRHKLQSATLELRTHQVEQERANKLLAEARLSSLESRIHPHFLFNTLNSIASLIPSDPKRAEATVSQLASLLRFSLNANHSSLVPLEQELKVVRDYLEIESTRFGARLRYEIAMPENLGAFKVPPLAVQTLVENSIKHVVAQRSCGAAIQISAAAHDGRLQVEVIDDGPGFSLASISPEHGLGNLSGRLQLLYGDRAQLDVLRRDAKTIVSVTLPAEA